MRAREVLRQAHKPVSSLLLSSFQHFSAFKTIETGLSLVFEMIVTSKGRNPLSR